MIKIWHRYRVVEWLRKHFYYVSYYHKFGNVTVMHLGNKYDKCKTYLLSKGFVESISGFGKNFTSQELGLCITLYGVNP